MIIYNPNERLLQDIAAARGIRLVIATDYPAELADMREPEAETYEPTAKEAEWLGTQRALVYGDCDLTAEQIDVETWQKETEVTRRMDEPR